MSILLDAAALVALDRNERAMWVRLKTAFIDGDPPLTHGGVVGQVWRGGARQARLARALAGIDVAPLDEPLGRRAGQLLGVAGQADVVDAALVILAIDGDEIITGDHGDIAVLAGAARRHVDLIHP